MNINIPRYFLTERELGFYGSMAYVTTAGWMIIQALAASASTRLAQCYHSGNVHTYIRLLIKLTAFSAIIGFSCVALIWFFGAYILTILYTKEFVSYNTVFVIVILAAAFSYMGGFMWQGVIAARLVVSQTIVSVVVMLVALIVSYLLIPEYRIMGAAISMLITSAINFWGAVIWSGFVVIKMKRMSTSLLS